MTAQAIDLKGLDKLKVPGDVRKDLEKFIYEILEHYKQNLISVTAFGSVVSGDFVSETSDVNLLVIYSDLDIEQLSPVAELAQRWLKKRKFSPRFLSKRNLVDSNRYFQIDQMEMRDSHVVLYGENILKTLPIHPEDMRWQLAYEIKSMRMRIKQQFWRACGNERMMRLILLKRFSSLMHLTRALFFLIKKPTPFSHKEIASLAVQELKIDSKFVDKMFDLKTSKEEMPTNKLVQLFDELMEMIRQVDDRVEQIKG